MVVHTSDFSYAKTGGRRIIMVLDESARHYLKNKAKKVWWHDPNGRMPDSKWEALSKGESEREKKGEREKTRSQDQVLRHSNI
jgi:hypothetical protein